MYFNNIYTFLKTNSTLFTTNSTLFTTISTFFTTIPVLFASKYIHSSDRSTLFTYNLDPGILNSTHLLEKSGLRNLHVTSLE